MHGALAAALRAPWLRDPLWTRARMVPALDLRPAETQSLRDWVSGRDLVTFTRASNGTRVTSAGGIETLGNDVPRFTFDAVTGRCLGLLVEEARTNLLVRSEEFDNASWVKARASVAANAAAAPNGTTTADRLVEDGTASNTHVAVQVYTFAAGSHTLSAFAKAAERSWIRLFAFDATTNFGCYFNLSAGTVGTAASSTGSIQALGNGWYRCQMTFTAAAGTGTVAVRLATSDGGDVYSGDNASGVLFWGAQLEAGAFPTSYIPTTGTAATRAADIATILSGLDFNTIRGMYAEFINPASGVRGIASLNDNTANERIGLNTSGTDPLLVVVDGGATQANIDAGTFAANSITRLAARFGPNDFAVSVNGGAEVVDTSGTMPTVDRLMIGRTQAGEYLNGSLARLVLFDRPPTDLRRLSA